MAAMNSDELIELYMREYEKKREMYARLQKYVCNICEQVSLQDEQDIRVHVTSRIKEADSLRKKLHKRRSKYTHEKTTIQGIRGDIVDILGVRILVYFPSSLENVENSISRAFTVDEMLDYPYSESILNPAESEARMARYKPVFPTYTAKHCRVRLQPDEQANVEGYANEIFEIQIVSALAHVWSEVQHNILYKPDIDHPNEDVERLMDSLNGSVKTGEVILNQLKQSIGHNKGQEKDFANKHELGVFLASSVPQHLVKKGSLNVLYRFLEETKHNKKTQVRDEIGTLGISKAGSLTTVGQKIKEDFKPFEPSASILIIGRMLKGLRRREIEELCSAKQQSVTPEGSASNDSSFYDCKVLISSLLWPVALFSPHTQVTSKIQDHFAEKEARQSLKWALESFMPCNIQCGESASKDDLEKLRSLRKIFEDTKDHMFQLCFKISSLGVWRELPEDFTLLEILRTRLLESQPNFFDDV